MNNLTNVNYILRRIRIRENINYLRNKKGKKNRLKRWQSEYKKITKRLENIVWRSMKRRIVEEDVHSALALAKIELEDSLDIF